MSKRTLQHLRGLLEVQEDERRKRKLKKQKRKGKRISGSTTEGKD